MDKAAEIIAELQTSYAMELETVQNYLANSVFLDGALAEKIKRSLAGEIEIVLRHARRLAKRIKVLGGRVPGSLELSRNQDLIQPPLHPTDVISVIKGVIHAQEAAITQYQKIIKLCDTFDFVTQDIIVELVSDEQEHRRRFMGFLADHTGHLTQKPTGDQPAKNQKPSGFSP
jgi:bacterioferritin